MARWDKYLQKVTLLIVMHPAMYGHLSYSGGDRNKCVGGAKVAKSINVEVGINMEGGIFGKN